ncbi:MAG: glycosyltransferase family 9 protein [Pseudomonadota bacterium]
MSALRQRRRAIDSDRLPSQRATWLQQHDGGNVVVFRALHLGDMLCAVPALRALRAALPASRITLVSLPWAEQFASRFPVYIDEFIAFPGDPALPEQAVRQHELADFHASVRARHFDIAVQLHGSGPQSNDVVSAFGAQAVAGFGTGTAQDNEFFLPYPDSGAEPLRLLALVRQLGAPDCGEHLEFPISDSDERELGSSGLGAEAMTDKYICIHPGARVRDKCWAPERFAQVADTLAAESGLQIVLTGSSAEAPLTAAVAAHMRSDAIDAAGPISIGAMAALMSRARLLISNDTGVSHIAAGLGLPSVVIFSKADIRRWAPLNERRHRSLWDPEGARVHEVLAHARSLLVDSWLQPRRHSARGTQ